MLRLFFIIRCSLNLIGKYGFIDGDGQLKVVEYSSQNGTGFELVGGDQATPAPAQAAPAPLPQQQQPTPDASPAQFNPLPAVPSVQAPLPQTPNQSQGPVQLSPQQFQAFQQAQQPLPTQSQLLTLQAQQNRIQAAQNAVHSAQGQPILTPQQQQQPLTEQQILALQGRQPSSNQVNPNQFQQPAQFPGQTQAQPQFKQAVPQSRSQSIQTIPPVRLSQEQLDFLDRQRKQIAGIQDQIAEARKTGAEFRLPSPFAPQPQLQQPQRSLPESVNPFTRANFPGQPQQQQPQQQQLFTREQVEQLLAQQRSVQNQAGIPPQFLQQPQALGSGPVPQQQRQPVFNAATFNPNVSIRSQFNSS